VGHARPGEGAGRASGRSICRWRRRSRPPAPSPTRTSGEGAGRGDRLRQGGAGGPENFTLRARRAAAEHRHHWREHLAALDYLRQGIHLRGYAQKQPKQEYKREAFELFGQLLDVVKNEVTRVLMTVRIQSSEQIEQAAQERRAASA
jgi:hypothetical protein